MPTTHRIVDIIVPNRTPRKVKASLTIRPVDAAQLEGLSLEAGEMEVVRFGLTEEHCVDAGQVKTLRRLPVELGAYQDKQVRAVIEVQEPPRGQPAVAAFRVTDTRDRVVAGGVTIVCTSPGYPARLPSAPDPINPCPLVLGAAIRSVDVGADPSSAGSGYLERTRPQDLVALVENGGSRDLTNTTVYLEHMGNSGVEVVPRVWHIGTVEPGGQFWATWEVDAHAAAPGQHEATFVAQSDNHEPVRLGGRFAIRPENW